MAALMLGRFGVDDYATWKAMFDSDPAGRKQVATGHRIFQNADDPNDVFLSVQFASADEAKAFRAQLLASGVLDQLTIKTEPTVVEEADAAQY